MTKYLDWEHIEAAVGYLVAKLEAETTTNTYVPYKMVVGISRGGLIPATLVAHRMNIKKVVSIIPATYHLGPPILGMHQRDTLLVDDIFDTGETLAHLQRISHSGTKTALFSKMDFPNCLWGMKLDTDEWIQFPWETSDES